MALRRILIVLVLAGLAGGCIAESANPLPPPPGGKSDKRLLGRWGGPDSATKGYMKISQEKGPWFRLSAVDPSGNPVGVEMLFTTANLNGHGYLSLKPVKMEGETVPADAPYMIVRYEMPDGDTVAFFAMGDGKVAKDIKENRIAGVITPAEPAGSEGSVFGGPSDNVLITADSMTLAKYVLKSDPTVLFAFDSGSMTRQ